MHKPVTHCLFSSSRTGFVRFARPSSVQRAMDRYRTAEIEVQDVSVFIKTLKSESPPLE